MTTTVTEKVALGAAFLDEKLPGWVNRVALDLLNMAGSSRCVLGQLHPDGFWESAIALTGYTRPEPGAFDHPDGFMGYGELREWAQEHGFYWTDSDVYYDELQPAWREFIEARQAAA